MLTASSVVAIRTVNRALAWAIETPVGSERQDLTPGRAGGRGQEKSFFACSLKSRIGPTGPTSMKVTPPSVMPVCPAGQW